MWYSKEKGHQSKENKILDTINGDSSSEQAESLFLRAKKILFSVAHSVQNLISKKSFTYISLILLFLITAGVAANQLYLPSLINLIESANSVASPNSFNEEHHREIEKALFAKNEEKSLENISDAEYSRSLVLLILEDWRKRWSAKDLKGFMYFYHPDFPDRKIFQNNKKRIFRKAKYIRITLKNISSKVENNQIVTSFSQVYQSKSFSDTATKELHWKQTDQGWKIIEEKIVNSSVAKQEKK